MTGASEYDQDPIGRWLADRHDDLRKGLQRFLDPRAGLQDAMLRAGHADVLGALDSTLDAEAGLAAIQASPTGANAQLADSEASSGSVPGLVLFQNRVIDEVSGLGEGELLTIAEFTPEKVTVWEVALDSIKVPYAWTSSCLWQELESSSGRIPLNFWRCSSSLESPTGCYLSMPALQEQASPVLAVPPLPSSA